MVKLVLTGLWVCAVTLAAVYFSVHLATAPASDPNAGKEAATELVKGETITVPIIANGEVTGYFLGRVSFMMNKDLVKDIKLPLTEMTTDELFTLLVGNKMIDIARVSSFDLGAFRDQIKKNMNERLGGDYVADVLVEQLDYLSKEEVRDTNSGGAKKTVTPVKIVPGGEAQPAAAGGH